MPYRLATSLYGRTVRVYQVRTALLVCSEPPRMEKGGRDPMMVPGAGDGNRTRVASLEGWGSTIELHRRVVLGADTARSQLPVFPGCHLKEGIFGEVIGHTPRGATRRARTADLLVTNQLLYRLSYDGMFPSSVNGSREGGGSAFLCPPWSTASVAARCSPIVGVSIGNRMYTNKSAAYGF